MKSLDKKIRTIAEILGNHEIPRKPVILNDVKLQEFREKMEDLIENYIYFNQDRNIVKASELLSEIIIYVLVTSKMNGLNDVFEKITKLVCEDIIDGTIYGEGGHRIPLVTQGNQTLIDTGTNKKSTHSEHIDNLIYRTMGGGNEDLRF